MLTGNYFYDKILAARVHDKSVFLEIPGEAAVTYAAAHERSKKLASSLVRGGVLPGDRVLVQIEKCPEALFLYLACVMAGAIFLPLNPAYSAKEMAYFASNSLPKVIVGDHKSGPSLETVARNVGAQLVILSNGKLPIEEGSTFDIVPREPNDIAAILYTSGTTGASKGAMLSHGNLVSNAEVLCTEWRFTTEDRLIHPLPVFHSHGLFVATNIALVSGCTLIFHRKFDIETIFDAMPSATSMMGVPTFYIRLLSDGRFTKELTANMRLFVSGSAPLLPKTHAEFEYRTGHAILERYGMTETNMITSNPYFGPRVAGTVGLPLPGISLRITDPETGRIVARNETGVIELKGPNVFKGYWNLPEKTASEFRTDGFFITGDLGVQDHTGVVSIVGRAKDLIISGGLNVYPREIEEKIDALDSVLECAVIGVPHPDFGEGIVSVIVPKGNALTLVQLNEALKGQLAKFKLPKRLYLVTDLPRNTMGKVQKKDLRKRFENAFSVDGKHE
jgi:malonyl-CoA/methylmalonyl-CoA synthetase